MRISDSVGFQDDDVIITLGDYVNRGPNTRAVLDWLIQLDHSHNLVPLRGNHDIMMSRARNNESDYRQWLEVGGVATLRSYAPIEGGPGAVSDIPERHWQFLTERLLPYYETDSHFFVHANAYSDIALDDQHARPRISLRKSRARFAFAPKSAFRTNPCPLSHH